MSPQLLSALLWIPFAATAVIAGLIYCIRGYKKGLWCALGSLGSVVLSTVLSILLARAISGAAAPALAANIPMDGYGQLTTVALQVAVVGVVTVALSVLLFGILMLILTPVISAIIGKLLGKGLITEDKTYRWLGLVAGVLSALVFTLCWLSPLYGTMAAVAPVAQVVVAMEENQEVAAYAEGVSDHLLVKAYSTKAVAVVYDNISRMPVGGSTVSVVQMSGVLKESLTLADQIQSIESVDAAQLTQLSTQLIDLSRTYFVEQDWFYTLFREGMTQLGNVVAASNREDSRYYSDLLALTDLSEDEFRSTMTTFLDVAVFAMEKDVFSMVENLSVTEVYGSGVIQELGKALNSTDRLVAAKKLLMAKQLEKGGLTYDQALELLEKYEVGKLTEEKDQIREVEALMIPTLLPKAPAVLMILRHPSLGGSAMLDVQEIVGFAKMMGMTEEQAASWNKDKQDAVIIAMMSLAKMDFEDLAGANMNLDSMLGGGNNKTEQDTVVDTPAADHTDQQEEDKPQKTEKPEDSGLSDEEKKQNVKDKMDEIGVEGAKDIVNKMDEDEKEDLKNTLDKMGVDSLEDAKNMVDKMDPDDIRDIMENMGYGDLAGQLGLK